MRMWTHTYTANIICIKTQEKKKNTWNSKRKVAPEKGKGNEIAECLLSVSTKQPSDIVSINQNFRLDRN